MTSNSEEPILRNRLDKGYMKMRLNETKVKWEVNYDESEVARSLIFLVFHCHQLKEVWRQCTYFTRNSEEPILRNPDDGYEEKR